MSKIIIAVILLAALAAGVRYFYPEILRDSPLEGLVNTSKPVYQWRDANGEWQVSDKPPPAGTDYEEKRYSLDVNLLPGGDPNEMGN